MAEENERLKDIHKVFLNFTKRAERSSTEALIKTFVDVGPLFTLLSTKQNQVIYGRRGTGKTHALMYLSHNLQKPGEPTIFLDLRNVGSTGSILSDNSQSPIFRSAQLIIDVLGAIHDEFYRMAYNVVTTHPNPGIITRYLDELQEAIQQTRIVGDVSLEQSQSTRTTSTKNLEAGVSQTAISAKTSLSGENQHQKDQVLVQSGHITPHLVFGNIASALAKMLDVLGYNRLWLLLDEWSEIPLELQPYLAELIRRIMLPIEKISIKIAAIEHRSKFRLSHDDGSYLGFELGADMMADLNLDDFLVFDNNPQRASDFMRRLIYKHFESDPEAPANTNEDDLIRFVFTQRPVFNEFVRAVEGVPRDALNLAAKVATQNFGAKVSMPEIRRAARDWYNLEKASIIRNDTKLSNLLNHIVEEVIGQRKSRAFLIRNDIRHLEVERLFDARLLHILKRNVSSNDQPGRRFDVYKIDYGCYVELINTAKEPDRLLDIDLKEGNFDQEVPYDDYRSIRRAILEFDDASRS